MNWKELLQSVADTEKQGTRYAFLLGAGASISSGIKGAADLTKHWLEQIKENNIDEFNKFAERTEYKKGDFAALYSEVYSARFLDPADGHLAIEKIMCDKKVWPSVGYSILAQVMGKTRHNLALTTNFDRLIETALFTYQNIHAKVIAHETLLDVIALDDTHPSIAKVHGDMFLKPKSDPGGVKVLNRKWQRIVSKVLNHYHFIVVGYGGGDDGLMKILSKALEENPGARIYWCYIDEKPEQFKEFSNKAFKQVVSIEIEPFDDIMFFLGDKLGYPTLDETLQEMADERIKLYKQQRSELGNRTLTDEDPEVTDAVSKLVAKTWGEVQQSVYNTQNPDEKKSLYLAGIEKFPESHELLGNYANFLKNICNDYDGAEWHYKKALEIDPDHGNTNGNYANFLNDIRKDYDAAERRYKKALEIDSESPNKNSNYANLLKNIHKDYNEAERHYKKALEVAPDHVFSNGSYAAFLLARGRTAEAKPFLENAEKKCTYKPFYLMLHFYRLAHFPETAEVSRKAIKELLEEGVCFPGADFSQNIEQAEKEGCTYVDELRELAAKISEVE